MASNHLLIPSSNFLKLKGFTNSFKKWRRPAPNAGSPFLRDNMQKLFALENNFLRGEKKSKKKKVLFSSLEQLWYFAAQTEYVKKWPWFCWDMALSSQNHVLVSSAWESSQSPLGSLFCKNHCTYLRRLPLEQEDSWCTASHPSSLF